MVENSAISPVSSKVKWSNTIWENSSLPKHCFISWLAVNDRLLTRYRLMRRGIIQSAQCCLCNDTAPETRDHLFFQCKFSQVVWNEIMEWLQFRWRTCEWNILIDWFSCKLRGKGPKQKVKMIALSSTIYSLWKERNNRTFKQVAKSTDQTVMVIKMDIMTISLNCPALEEIRAWLITL
ncbi:uncharacterized protein LOC109831061 [Asparagus officinalis]|uniref:uncharacterized protein LOC109831061 n=1 Tax=Asparagus officinalis TaxID=4686 RepID=UPI00098E1C3D|nr:uncharacterized protein LOC109831061 [Asparagus officinalis]